MKRKQEEAKERVSGERCMYGAVQQNGDTRVGKIRKFKKDCF